MSTRLVDDRAQALRVGYEATSWTHPVQFEDYAAAVENWTIKAIVKDGACIGAAYFNNGEVHVSVLPNWRRKWATKGLLKELFAGENVWTRVTPGHDYMYSILQRLGFVKVADNVFVKEC